MAAVLPGPLSLRHRVLLVVAVLAALLVGTGAAALIGQDRANAATARVTERALPGLVAVERLQRAFVDQQTAVRGYLLTGRQGFLEPYRAAGPLIAAQEAVLRTELDDDPAVPERLDAVLRGHRAWLEVADSAITLQAAGRTAEITELIDSGRGSALFAALRADVDGLRGIIERRIEAEGARVVSVRSVLLWVLSLAAGAGVLCAVLAVAGVRRAVTRPLGDLVSAVGRVADGELDRPVPAVGPPEFAVLGRAVDRMRRMLNDDRRAAVVAARREAELRESDRVAADLRDGAVRRLFALSRSLSALTNRHPAVAAELRGPLDELDRAIAEVRAAAVGAVRDAGAQTLAAAVVDVLEQAPDLAGAHPALHVDPAAGRLLPAEAGQVLVAAFRAAVDGLRGTRAAEVELTAVGDGVRLCLTVAGAVPDGWADAVRERGGPVGGRCRVGGGTDRAVVEWTVPAAGG